MPVWIRAFHQYFRTRSHCPFTWTRPLQTSVLPIQHGCLCEWIHQTGVISPLCIGLCWGDTSQTKVGLYHREVLCIKVRHSVHRWMKHHFIEMSQKLESGNGWHMCSGAQQGVAKARSGARWNILSPIALIYKSPPNDKTNWTAESSLPCAALHAACHGLSTSAVAFFKRSMHFFWRLWAHFFFKKIFAVMSLPCVFFLTFLTVLAVAFYRIVPRLHAFGVLAVHFNETLPHLPVLKNTQCKPVQWITLQAFALCFSCSEKQCE